MILKRKFEQLQEKHIEALLIVNNLRNLVCYMIDHLSEGDITVNQSDIYGKETTLLQTDNQDGTITFQTNTNKRQPTVVGDIDPRYYGKEK